MLIKNYSKRFFLGFCLSITLTNLKAFISDDLFSKRFASLGAFEQELIKYGLMDLDKECLEGSQEACFALEKIMEKEVKDFVEVAQHFERRQKTKAEEAALQAATDNHLSPGLVQEWQEYKKRVFEWYMKKIDEQKLSKLRKLACKSTADIEGVKRYTECRKAKLRNKYRRLQQKYPNKPENGYVSSEKRWLSDLRFLKKSCLHWGTINSCIELQKKKISN